MTYDEIRPRLRTGDLILFSAKTSLFRPSTWISRLIKRVTRSEWSHVGLVVQTYFGGPSSVILSYESTTMSEARDVRTRKPLAGVQLVLFSQRLRTYRGKIAIRHLQLTMSGDQLLQLSQYRKRMRGKPYERNYLELLGAAFNGWFGRSTENFKSVFCSELVAGGLMAAGVIPEGVANHWAPGDFGAGGNADAFYGPEIEVT